MKMGLIQSFENRSRNVQIDDWFKWSRSKWSKSKNVSRFCVKLELCFSFFVAPKKSPSMRHGDYLQKRQHINTSTRPISDREFWAQKDNQSPNHGNDRNYVCKFWTFACFNLCSLLIISNLRKNGDCPHPQRCKMKQVQTCIALFVLWHYVQTYASAEQCDTGPKRAASHFRQHLLPPAQLWEQWQMWDYTADGAAWIFMWAKRYPRRSTIVNQCLAHSNST